MPEQARYHILVVDDDRANRFIMRSFLESVGYRVSTAKNGLEAFEAYQTEMPDLVLMDLDMPEMDGLAATREIRAWEQETQPQHPHVPIIAFSGYLQEVQMQQCLEAGMDDGMLKPPMKENLENKLQAWLTKAHSMA